MDLASFIHGFQNVVLALAVLALVQFDLPLLAVLLLVASKWRVFATRLNKWLGNLRSNGCDIIVAFSLLTLMIFNDDLVVRAALTGLYCIWLLFIKPQSKEVAVGLQALLCHFIGLTALFVIERQLPGVAVLILSGLIGYTAARHFLSSFEEPMSVPISTAWAAFIVQLAWLAHLWLISYDIGRGVVIPQMSLIASLLAYSFANVYRDRAAKQLSRARIFQYTFFSGGLVLLILLATDWQGSI